MPDFLEPRMYLLQPTVVFAALVNQSVPATYPIESVVYDGVTTGAYTDIKPGMTLLIGSTPGADDLGRQRVRELNGAPATSIVIWVGRSSRGTHDGELTLTDNAYITVWDDRRVWAKTPYIAPDGEIYKDSNMEVGTNTTNPPPVANCGPGTAATIDPVTNVITVLFNGQNSFAVADGATIVSFLWDIKDGTLLVGSALTDDNITATFPAGKRYVELTVTDSNGKSHTSSCFVLADDPANRLSFDAFQIESRRFTDAGQQMTVSILADMPRATYPDGTLCLVWEREPTGTADRDHMLIIGWLDVENATLNAGRTGLVRDTTLTILDIAAKLDTLPGFPQSLAADSTRDVALIPAITWSYMVNPNLDKYLHYLLHWHSTALELADFTWSGVGASYPFVLLSSDGDSLWNQVDRRARAFVPDYVLTCDLAGRIAVEPDPMLRDVADRTAVVLAAIDEDEWSSIRFSRQRAPRIHWLEGNAILAGSTTPIGTVFSIAPGEAPGQGLGATTQGEKLAISQAALNAATGHRYARINAAQGLVTVTLVQDDGGPGSAVPWREIEPAYKQWVTLTMGPEGSPETAAQRGVMFTAARALPKEVNIRYNQTKTGLTRTVELTLEMETEGEPGVTVTKPTVPAVGAQPLVTTPPAMGLIGGQQVVAGISQDALYRTSDFQTVSASGGPTWDKVPLTTDSNIVSWVVDPFSPGYIDGVGAVNGWAVTNGNIYRIADIFGAVPSCTSVHAFPTATVPASYHWRSIQASFGAYFAEGVNPWLLCISYYGDTVGHTGTWATYSVDGGVTWATEVQVSAFYDSGLSAINPIGVYASPKTPGLAYTAAHRSGTADALMPHWGILLDSTLTEIVESPTVSITTSQTAIDSGGTLSPGNYRFLLAPPADAVRVTIDIAWQAERTRTNTFSGSDVDHTHGDGTQTLTINTFDFVLPAYNSGVSAGSYTMQWTSGAGIADWSRNREDLATYPGGTDYTSYARFQFQVSANSISAASTGYASFSITATVTEIELDDGTIYTPVATAVGGFVSGDWGATWSETSVIEPGEGQAGSIHLPWPDNDTENIAYYGYLEDDATYQLIQSASGVKTDISPLDGSIKYGVNHYGFSVRSYDSDRDHMALGGIGNDAGTTKVGLWVSSNAGTAWTNILAPVAASNALYGLQIAFAGDSSSVLYAWGGWTGSLLEPIYYSSDFGVTLDSREGNLASLGTIALLGIAGGPTGA